MKPPAAHTRARYWSSLLILALLATLVSGCRLLERRPTKPRPKQPKPVTPLTPPVPTAKGPTQELGTAAYPVGTPTTSAAMHSWTAKLTPNSYRVGYALSPSERAAVLQSFQTYAQSVGLVEGSDGRFKWMPPRECAGDLHCPYQNIASRGSADLEPLVEKFRARQRASSLSIADIGALVITFVQNIRYEIPESPFGILPPPLVVAEQRGDCDSKSLLGHMILRSLGIDSVVMSSSAHKHAMLAIALPATGTKVTYAGRQYAFTEMTAKGSPLGHINPSLLRPNDWKVVPIQYAASVARR